MTGASAAVFCMPLEGHLRRMLPVIRGLRQRGIEPRVWTDARFRVQVEGAGGILMDLFGRYPLDRADAASSPLPSRYVSFAGHYGEAICAEVAAARPSLVVADTFAVIGRVVARASGLPWVNVCAGHDVEPARFIAGLARDPRVDLDPACHAAVARLRDIHGLEDASPFCYVSGVSRDLNLYGEPPEWLTATERRTFEPLAFFGSLPSVEHIERRIRAAEPHGFPEGARLRVYVSFGTVIWRYYAREALAALGAIAEAIASIDGAAGIISLGGAAVPEAARRSLQLRGVQVAERVDQWAVLAGADLFVTHHGLNSTHEAVFHGVPMLSLPFFWDQPALAARCQAFGLATPLAPAPRAPLDAEEVARALLDTRARRDDFGPRLAQAREWELAVMDGRPAVLDRIARLARYP